jgi:exosome complex RNA-binding protein Csl4
MVTINYCSKCKIEYLGREDDIKCPKCGGTSSECLGGYYEKGEKPE